ncbi:TIR domain-containing protein [Mesorhizobium sp. IMUNJ 23033]|uniref:TIR domain-containing protein n=1 Tax=Mesorhizobium sp. IMUNJ 23033 TaxID=3378039 RepID=UPI00384BB01A
MGTRFDTKDGERRLRAALQDQEILRGSDPLIEAVINSGQVKSFEKGEDIIVQDDETDDLFFIVSGACEIIVNGRRIASRGRGSAVGEMAAIEPSQTRSATIRALESTVALKVSGEAFAALGQKHPIIYQSIARSLAKRLRERNKHVGKHHEITRVFLISSKEGLDVAEALRERFDHDDGIEVSLWTDGVFRLSEYALESLEAKLDECDFGVAIATGEDSVESREKKWPAPRDNVILELGLFMGRLGRERAILVEPRGEGIKLPSDTLGMTTITYTFNPKDPLGSLGSAYSKLKRHIKEKGPYNG